jgi:transposase
VSHNKRQLHRVGYFRDLMVSNENIDDSIRPLLQLSRDTITRLQGTESALVRSLQRDPLLTARVQRLKTVPGVGPITALTWALEMGDISRFRSIRQVISYCWLCGDEKRSAEKVMRTPLSRQRNKHIQSWLVEAVKLAPRYDHDLALVYENEKKKGNANRATLAVGSQDGCISDGGGSRTTGFCTCGTVQPGCGLKTAPTKRKSIRITERAGCQVLHLTQ